MTQPPGRALVALGANVPFGELQGPAMLAAALARMQDAGFTLIACSSVWQTAPWPPSEQPSFYNAVAAFDVEKRTPQDVFERMREIESGLGRVRRERWGPRTLDLDLLDLDGLVGTFGEITLPHPRLQERAFVLAPLMEIAPDWRHPELGKSVGEMLAGLSGGQKAERLGPIPLPGRSEV